MTSTTSDPTASLPWSDELLLGYPQLDQVHEEFVDIVGRMEHAGDAELPDLLGALADHARAHFALEDGWMRDTAFPPRECHIDEHAAVLQSIEDVRELLAQGNVEVCRRLVQELIRWFPSHAHHLDSALAHWISKQRTGGKPVVLRRGLQLR